MDADGRVSPDRAMNESLEDTLRMCTLPRGRFRPIINRGRNGTDVQAGGQYEVG